MTTFARMTPQPLDVTWRLSFAPCTGSLGGPNSKSTIQVAEFRQDQDFVAELEILGRWRFTPRVDHGGGLYLLATQEGRTRWEDFLLEHWSGREFFSLNAGGCHFLTKPGNDAYRVCIGAEIKQ